MSLTSPFADPDAVHGTELENAAASPAAAPEIVKVNVHGRETEGDARATPQQPDGEPGARDATRGPAAALPPTTASLDDVQARSGSLPLSAVASARRENVRPVLGLNAVSPLEPSPADAPLGPSASIATALPRAPSPGSRGSSNSSTANPDGVSPVEGADVLFPDAMSPTCSRATAAPPSQTQRRGGAVRVVSPTVSSDFSAGAVLPEVSMSGFSDPSASILTPQRWLHSSLSTSTLPHTQPLRGNASTLAPDEAATLRALLTPPSRTEILRQRKHKYGGLSIQNPSPCGDAPPFPTTAEEAAASATAADASVVKGSGEEQRQLPGAASLTPLFNRAKRVVASPGAQSISSRVRRERSSGSAGVASPGPLSARRLVSNWVSPLLRTPEIRHRQTTDVSSPVVIDRGVLEEPPHSPATFGDALRDVAVKQSTTTHASWQTRSGETQQTLSPSFLLIPTGDRVCIHWYDGAEEVFETDHSYLRVVPGGRHSCYNTADTPDAEEEEETQEMGHVSTGGQRGLAGSPRHPTMQEVEDSEVARQHLRMASSLRLPSAHGSVTQASLAHADSAAAATAAAVLATPTAGDGVLLPRQESLSSPYLVRFRTPQGEFSNSLSFHDGLPGGELRYSSPRLGRSAYRARRAASEVFLTTNEGGQGSLADGHCVTAATTTAAAPAAAVGGGGSDGGGVGNGDGRDGFHSRQPSAGWMLQRAETRAALGDNCHTFTVQFPKPGDYYFVLSRHKRSMRLHVQVYTAESLFAWRLLFVLAAAALLIALVVVVVLVLAYWMHHSTYIFNEESAASYEQYLAFLDIHSVITLDLFPWLAVGVLTVLLVIIAAVGWSVYRCFRPPRAGSFSRGVPALNRRVLAVGAMVCGAALVVLLFVVYGLELNVTNGVNDLAESLATAIISNLNMFSTAALQVNWLVGEAGTMLPDMTLPVAQISAATRQVSNLLSDITKWTSFIENIGQVAFRVIPVVLFLAMQMGLFATALMVVALVLRFRKAAVAAAWMLAVSLGFFACTCGIQFAITTVFGKVYTSVVVLRDDPANFGNTLGLSNSSFVSQLFSLCTISIDDVSVVSSFVRELLLEVNSTLSGESQAEFQQIFGFITSAVPTTMEALANYTAYIQANLNTLIQITEKDGAAVNALAQKNVVPMLQVLLSIVQTLSGLVNCQVLRDVVADAIPIFQNAVQSYNTAVLVFLVIVFAVSAVLLAFAIGAAYAVRHPRKTWCCQRTGRWFRFRYSYKVHIATLMRSGKTEAREVTVLEWLVLHSDPLMQRLLTTRVVCCASSSLMFFDSILLVLFNQASRGTKATKTLHALSYLGCAQLFFLLATTLFRRLWVRWLLRATGLLCAMGCLGVSVAQAIIGFVFAGQCMNHSRYNMEGMSYGSPVSMTCSAVFLGSNLESAIYASVCFMNSVTLVVTTAMLLRYERFFAAAAAVRREYAGVLLPLKRFIPPLQWLFQDHMFVKRIYTGVLIGVVVLFLILFAVLDISNFSVLKNKGSSVEGGSDIVQVIDPSRACNGRAAYCNLRANQIIWACAHNAHSSLEDGFVLPNHYYNITHQLYAGIRSFMIDVWYDIIDPNVSDAKDVYVCHSVCVVGRRPYRTIAQEFKNFLDAYPDQVIMIIFEQYVNSSDLGRISDEVGLTQYVWYNTQTPPNYNPDYVWPTLQELINSNQRALMYNDVLAALPMSRDCPEWLYYSFDFQFENYYQTDNTSVWQCDIHRGWCTDTPETPVHGNSSSDSSSYSSSSSSSSAAAHSGSSSSSSSSSSDDALRLVDITNCDEFGANPLWRKGSKAYNAAFNTNPPNVRSKMSTMNHFITTGTGSPVSASQANVAASVRYMTWSCSSQWNAVVNILAFDFWSIANPLATIDVMNQNIAKYGPQNNFQDAWSLMLFDSTNAP